MTATNLPNGNYIPIDMNLINNPQYEKLSIEAMMLHALYTMRMTCSIYNSQKDGSWLDEAGIPFINTFFKVVIFRSDTRNKAAASSFEKCIDKSGLNSGSASWVKELSYLCF